LSFAPIAPDNATGNFTKVVQRVPVKITIDQGQEAASALSVGLSVETDVAVGRNGKGVTEAMAAAAAEPGDRK